ILLHAHFPRYSRRGAEGGAGGDGRQVPGGRRSLHAACRRRGRATCRRVTMRVLIKGAGVAGLTLAHELAERGADVEVAEIAAGPGGGASWFAGGMLAPWCEAESAPDTVVTLGRGAAGWWDAALP